MRRIDLAPFLALQQTLNDRAIDDHVGRTVCGSAGPGDEAAFHHAENGELFRQSRTVAVVYLGLAKSTLYHKLKKYDIDKRAVLSSSGRGEGVAAQIFA